MSCRRKTYETARVGDTSDDDVEQQDWRDDLGDQARWEAAVDRWNQVKMAVGFDSYVEPAVPAEIAREVAGVEGSVQDQARVLVGFWCKEI